MDGCDVNSIGSSAGSAIAGQFIDVHGPHGSFMAVTTFGTGLAGDCADWLQADQGFHRTADSTEVSV